MLELVYLDHAASTPMLERALEALVTATREHFANPASAHRLGAAAEQALEKARSAILETCGGMNRFELLFTSSATEANNTVLASLRRDKGYALVSRAEHPSLVKPLLEAESPGIETRELPLLPSGAIDEYLLEGLLGPDCRLVALTHANNQSGVLQDIPAIASLVRRRAPGAHLHVDAAQSFAKLELRLEELDVDSLSTAAHKMGGPRGIAALFLRKGVELAPLLRGGGHEHGRRSSTPAVALAVAFSVAVSEAAKQRTAWVERALAARDRLVVGLRTSGIDHCLPFVEGGAPTSPYLVCLLLPGIPSDVVMRHLETRGVIVSSTSACSSRKRGPNPVLSALHLPEALHASVLRLSFGHTTTLEEVERGAICLVEVCKDVSRLKDKR